MSKTEPPGIIAQIQKCKQEALKLLSEMSAFTVLLTDEDRASMARARESFVQPSLDLAAAAEVRPKLLAAVDGYDVNAIREHIANVQQIVPLANIVGLIVQRLADTTLSWNAQAWSPSLEMYSEAKRKVKKDAELGVAIKGMAAIFKRTRRAMTPAEKAVKNAQRRETRKLAKARALIDAHDANSAATNGAGTNGATAK